MWFPYSSMFIFLVIDSTALRRTRAIMDPAESANADDPGAERPPRYNILSIFQRKITSSYDQIPLTNSDVANASSRLAEVSPELAHDRSHVYQPPDAKSEATIDRDHLPPKSYHLPPKWRGWRRPLKHFGIFVALALIICFLVVGSLVPSALDSSLDDVFIFIRGVTVSIPAPTCLPPLGSFVGIDVPVAHLSFFGAKGVDLTWNWVVGRGVQLLLATLAYRVFTDGLMKALEAQPMPLETVVALSLFTVQPIVLRRVLASLFRAPGWRVKMLVLWALLSTIFLAAFPSMLDLASGYDSRQHLYLVQPGGVTIQLDSSAGTSRTASALAIRTSIDDLYTYDYRNATTNRTDRGNLYTFYHVQWKNTNLQTSWDSVYNESAVKEYTDRREVLGSAFSEEASRFYLSDASNYQCDVEQDAYVWGFAFAWLLVAASVTSAWLAGLWMFWVDADHNSEMCRKRRRMGPYRAIVDMGNTLRAELGEELGGYSERELRKVVKGRVRSVKYMVDEREEGGAPRVRLATGRSARVRLEWNKPYA